MRKVKLVEIHWDWKEKYWDLINNESYNTILQIISTQRSSPKVSKPSISIYIPHAATLWQVN